MIRLRDPPRLTRDKRSAMPETRRRQLDTRARRARSRLGLGETRECHPPVEGGSKNHEAARFRSPAIGDVHPRSQCTRDARCVSALCAFDVANVASFRHSADGKINTT